MTRNPSTRPAGRREHVVDRAAEQGRHVGRPGAERRGTGRGRGIRAAPEVAAVDAAPGEVVERRIEVARHDDVLAGALLGEPVEVAAPVAQLPPDGRDGVHRDDARAVAVDGVGHDARQRVRVARRAGEVGRHHRRSRRGRGRSGSSSTAPSRSRRRPACAPTSGCRPRASRSRPPRRAGRSSRAAPRRRRPHRGRGRRWSARRAPRRACSTRAR